MKQKSGRVRSIDALRGVAVLLVLGRHIAPSAADGFVLNEWRRIGWIGVDLFFVLSGYLVSGLFFDEYKRNRTVRPWRFLVRRGFKIYPLFYVLIAVTALLHPSARQLLSEATFAQNYLGGYWNHTWSLAVEEHFYVLLTIGVAVAARRRMLHQPAFFACLVAIIVAAPVLRTAALIRNPHAWTGYQTQFRIDALAVGVALAWMRRFGYQRKQTAPLLWALLLLTPALLFAIESPFMLTIGFTSNALAFGLLLAVCTASKWRPPAVLDLAMDGLATVGVYSYAIYLWHMLVLHYLEPQIATLPRVEFVPIYVGAAIAAGVVTSRLIERPLLALRQRLVS